MNYFYLPSKKISDEIYNNAIEINIFKEILENKSFFTSFQVQNVQETCEYLLNSIGKILYVKIYDNKLQKFLPIKNQDYENIWQRNKTTKTLKGYINLPQDNKIDFVLDNFVVKEFVVDDEQDYIWIWEFFVEFLKNRQVKDCEFFINYSRESPVCKKNKTDPNYGLGQKNLRDYYAIENSHNVFSFSSSKFYKDFCMINYTDYQRIKTNTFGIQDFRRMKWEEKTKMFFLQTNSINFGVYTNKYPYNQKYKLIEMMKPYFSDLNTIGITSTDYHTFLIDGKVYENVVDPSIVLNEQVELFSDYKFIFCCDNTAAPWDLSTYLFSGSCIIRIESPLEMKTWYDDFLIENVHYILVDKDLKNLQDKINWCINHEEECKQIGINARNFATTFLSTNGIFDYIQMSLLKINDLNYEQDNSLLEMNLKKYYMDSLFSQTEELLLPYYKNIQLYPLYEGKFKEYCLKRHYATLKSLIFQWIIDPDFENNSNNIFFRDLYTDSLKGIHTAFVGIKYMNSLLREIPNFAFTYGYYVDESNNIIVLSENLSEYQRMDLFLKNNEEHFEIIFLQLCLALQLVHEKFMFSHNNLSLKKIFIKTFNEPQKIIYPLKDKTWAISSKIIPIIVDFSNSTLEGNCSLSLVDFETKLLTPLSSNKNNNIIETPPDNKIIFYRNNGNKINFQNNQYSIYHPKKKQYINFDPKLMSSDYIVGDIIDEKINSIDLPNIQDNYTCTECDMYNISKYKYTEIPITLKYPIDFMRHFITKKIVKEKKIHFGTYLDKVNLQENNPIMWFLFLNQVEKVPDVIMNNFIFRGVSKGNTELETKILFYEIVSCLLDLKNIPLSDTQNSKLNHLLNIYKNYFKVQNNISLEDNFKNININETDKVTICKYTQKYYKVFDDIENSC